MSRTDGVLHRLIARTALALGLVRSAPQVLREARVGEVEPIDPSTRFEPGDINVTGVLLTGAGILLGLWAIVVLVYPFFAYLARTRAVTSPPPIAAGRQGNPLPPEPRIQADPRRDLGSLRAYEDGALKGYHWVDRAHGVVTIPIDRAMRILTERGIQPQPDPGGFTYFDPHAGTRQTGFEGKVKPEPE